MDFNASQRDMNSAYLGGATGVLASGLVWGISAMFAAFLSTTAGMAALFIGGMFIFPLSIIFSKIARRSGKHATDNVLKYLAFENLGVLFAGLFLAFAIAQTDVGFFYPVMLLAIGTRYLTFQTLYGLKTYWFLGGALILAGVLALVAGLPVLAGALIGSIIEIVFSVIVFKESNTQLPTPP